MENEGFLIEWSESALRDQFAMAALTGLLGDQSSTVSVLKSMKMHDKDLVPTVSDLAYAYADAMMEARKK